MHTINRHAKRFDQKADTAYRTNEGANARVHSLRKKALYRTKTVAVHRLAKGNPAQTRITLHDLNGTNEMYCFSFSDKYSFHQPMAAVDDLALESVLTSDIEDAIKIDFQPSADVQDLAISLSEALRTLAEAGINANDYLDATSVLDYDWNDEIPTTFECIETETSE